MRIFVKGATITALLFFAGLLGSCSDLTIPAAPALPTTIAPTSEDNTSTPPAALITDDNNDKWSIGPTRKVLKNGVQVMATNLSGEIFPGFCSEILWRDHAIYVLGLDDNRWWQWTGSTFVIVAEPDSIDPPAAR